MRSIGAAAAAAARRHTSLPYSYAPAFSSSSGNGGGDGGFGHGRGRGLPTSGQPRAPGRPISDDDGADPFSAIASVGRGRGSGEPAAPCSSPSVPSFAVFSGVGRGRGSPLPPPPPPDDDPKQPTFTNRFDNAPQRPDPEQLSLDASSSPPPPPPRTLPFSGAGRGALRTQQPAPDKPPEENRFIRRREAAKQAAAEPSKQAPATQQPKLSSQEAAKRAVEILGGGDRSSEDGGGRGGRGRGSRGRGPGRGRFRGRGRDDRRSVDVEDDQQAIYLGDNADGDKLEQRLGKDKMQILEQAFMEAADNALPDPMEDAYLEASHTNNMIEFEPEYHVNFGNPDIDEKPPMSLEEMLQKVKPFIVAYEGIQNQEEWEESVKDVMARAPHMKELIDMYSGPDVVTAKQQEEELQRVANTLPESIPSSVKRFTDKTLLSLKNNPGWGFDKKCQFMDKFTRIVSEQYK